MDAILPPPSPIFADGMAPDWRRWSFDWQAGRPAVVILINAAPPERARGIATAFTAAAARFAQQQTDILVLGGAEELAACAGCITTPVSVIRIDADFLAESGVPCGTVGIFLVDRAMRVAWQARHEAVDAVEDCMSALRTLSPERPAPVLIVPNLLSPALCRALIDFFEHGESIAGKVAGLDGAGSPRSCVDLATKKRRDMQLRPDDPLCGLLSERLIQRCAPEIAKAFRADIRYTDRLMLARYDAPGGRFRRHRDDVNEAVAFRQFAISVNLNLGDYQGGHLAFPEYNDQPYAPPTGGGVIFSASLLHEAAPVTQGRRYVLLTFLHGERSEAQRRAAAAGAHVAVDA